MSSVAGRVVSREFQERARFLTSSFLLKRPLNMGLMRQTCIYQLLLLMCLEPNLNVCLAKKL